ncbi:unnamed protein product [Amoebophrya sp. A120]|nr:unnamed protein product [Amoebophrya sp. A120]|eukprot:GSA120T00014618001.1
MRIPREEAAEMRYEGASFDSEDEQHDKQVDEQEAEGAAQEVEKTAREAAAPAPAVLVQQQQQPPVAPAAPPAQAALLPQADDTSSTVADKFDQLRRPFDIDAVMNGQDPPEPRYGVVRLKLHKDTSVGTTKMRASGLTQFLSPEGNYFAV